MTCIWFATSQTKSQSVVNEITIIFLKLLHTHSLDNDLNTIIWNTKLYEYNREKKVKIKNIVLLPSGSKQRNYNLMTTGAGGPALAAGNVLTLNSTPHY